MFWLKYEELRDLMPREQERGNELMRRFNRYYINDYMLVPIRRWSAYCMGILDAHASDMTREDCTEVVRWVDRSWIDDNLNR